MGMCFRTHFYLMCSHIVHDKAVKTMLIKYGFVF